MRFKNREDAGKQLADTLSTRYAGEDVVVYALPRGGVVLGKIIADKLRAPLDLIITRKIGHPDNPEYAVCAVTETGELLCNEAEQRTLPEKWLFKEAQMEQTEAMRRRMVYLSDREHIAATNKTAIVVDDGVATGLTIRAALHDIRKEKPKALVVAVPVAPHDIVLSLKDEADTVVVLEDAHDYLGAVGAYYDDFPQVSDREVIALIAGRK